MPPTSIVTGAECGRTISPAATGLDLIKHATADARTRRMQHLVVVETTVLDIERGQPAVDHVMAALRGGAHVVTANKGPVAFAYREIMSVSEIERRRFLFEGAVMDGIPVFNLVRETLPAVDVLGFRGIINTTAHYILTAMESGRTYGEALAEMQAEGIAEADPSFDVDGWDAAAKTAALVNVLMRGAVTPRTIDRTGIRGITPEDMQNAVRRGKRIRLVASAARHDGQILARVAPEALDASDPLAGLGGRQNQLVLDTDVLGPIGIQQLEGGLVQTAYALLSDLVSLARSLGRTDASA
jgi:homoserine dehydrogenase